MVGQTWKGFSPLWWRCTSTPRIAEKIAGSTRPELVWRCWASNRHWPGCTWAAGEQQPLALGVQWECGCQGWGGLQSQWVGHTWHAGCSGQGMGVQCRQEAFKAYELYSSSSFCVKEGQAEAARWQRDHGWGRLHRKSYIQAAYAGLPWPALGTTGEPLPSTISPMALIEKS